MKAYSLSIHDNDDAGEKIVFAETAKAAKKRIGNLQDNLESYLDLRVNRSPEYDGMENLSPALLAKEQWRRGWRWFDLDYPDPDEATDEEFIAWYEDMFKPKEATNATQA